MPKPYTPPESWGENIVTIPPNMAIAGWDFDVDSLQRFCKEFGIKWDVSIRFTSGQYTRGSRKTIANERGNWMHRITLSQIRDQAAATKTLLHELCHAIQVEKVGDPYEFSRQYRQYSSGNFSKRYLANPFEVEARNFAEENAEEWSSLLY